MCEVVSDKISHNDKKGLLSVFELVLPQKKQNDY